MWLLPSRQRPENLKRFFDHYVKTKATTPGLVLLDDNDPELESYASLKYPDGWAFHVERPCGVGAMLNNAFVRLRYCDWFGLIADDVVPQSDKWDVALIEAASNDGVAIPFDSIHKGKQFTHGVLGGDFVRGNGWLILPGLVKLYGDNVITEIAKSRDVLRYCPDVVLEHFHFSNGKAEMDATYQKPYAAQDRELYELWRATW